MAVATGHVVLSDLEKRFDDVAVVRGIDLDIASGEFFSLLGPSGCGKTTTLRIIGGFERPDRGSVWIDGEEVTDLAPEHRPVNTVFQSYALFPHLTVERNVAFGLRFQKVSTDEVGTRVARALDLVELGGLEGRRPHQLSGGQQQRVALARALILEPRVLLLDEPLGALDARLRKALQVELRSLQQAIGITFVYVTHDQEEALTMSDRLAVMDEGRLVQVGTPREVYEEPIDGSVADFLGVANLLDVEHLGGGRVQVGDRVLRATGDGPVGRCRVVIRPERVLLVEGEPDNGLPVVVERRVFTGATTQVHLRSGDVTFHALVANSGGVAGDGATHAEMPVDALRLLAS